MAREEAAWGMLRFRRCPVPTWRGWLVLLVVGWGVSFWGLRGLCRFLAPNDPKPGGVLVAEGWLPDNAMEATIEEFRHRHYEKLYVTGGPLEAGAPLSEYKTFAELGGATLLKMGFQAGALEMVPAPLVPQDRTFVSAVALRRWWQAHGVRPRRVTVMSLGPHARRSRLLFEKALGPGVEVGVCACRQSDFDAEHWWRSSGGFRVVTDEAIAYVYARLFFRSRDLER